MSHKKSEINIKLQEITKDIFCYHFPKYQNLNKNILDKFHLFKNHTTTRNSHFFEDRYENIYIPSDLIEEINTVLFYCNHCVKIITGKNSLHSGLWFNYMNPGNLTLPHSHDEADELYSAVYYVKVPENSGDLIIKENNQDITIHPQEGMFVLFPPTFVHHVTKNNSNEARLSLGINIGS
ncbi:MAG: putative 2OG-Fe(II) oxygenase [Thiohalomonadales bacterium]